MSPAWPALLLLIFLDEAGSVRPVVTFHPNWDIIFTSESLNMSCDVRSPIPGDTSYVWYKNTMRTHTGPTLIITNAKEGDSGDYQCKSATSGRSDPTTLNVKPHTFIGYVILQVPLHVHEGDDVTLRCHHYTGYTGGDTIFYKDGVVIRNWGSDPELPIKSIDVGRSHRYKCTKKLINHGRYYRISAESSITVRELFSTPEIRVTPSPIIEGDHVTVTCHTNVSPYRPETPLTFAFHKDGQNVQSFGISDQYGVRSAHPGDSGKYSCEVTVSGGSIVKRSDEIYIEINDGDKSDSIFIQNIFRMILSGVILLLCLIFVVYHIRFINSLELVNRKLQRSPEL